MTGIDKNNYETYFAMYVDNELTAAGRKEVEEFVKNNPELQEELDAFMHTILAPEVLTFDKSMLFKNVSDEVDEEMLVRYVDNELNDADRKRVENHASENKNTANELALFQRTVLTPEYLEYKDKSSLYRRETKVVALFQWRRVAVAAIIVLVGGAIWITANKSTEVTIPQQIAEATVKAAPNKKDYIPSAQGSVTQAVEEGPKPIAAVDLVTDHVTEKGVIKRVKQVEGTTVDEPIERTKKKLEPAKVVSSDITDITATVEGLAIAGIGAKEVKVLQTAVKPLLLTEEDFKGRDDKEAIEPAVAPENIAAHLDNADDSDGKVNSNIRGILRKTSRYLNRNKIKEAAEADETTPAVRIANFYIAKK